MVILITGASSGMGKRVAQRLANAGHTVCLLEERESMASCRCKVDRWLL